MANNLMTDLQRQAQKAILDDPRTKEHGIEVLNENGVITLQGYVPSREVKEAAEAIVKDVPKVVSIINQLKIQTEKPEGSLIEKVMNT